MEPQGQIPSNKVTSGIIARRLSSTNQTQVAVAALTNEQLQSPKSPNTARRKTSKMQTLATEPSIAFEGTFGTAQANTTIKQQTNTASEVSPKSRQLILNNTGIFTASTLSKKKPIEVTSGTQPKRAKVAQLTSNQQQAMQGKIKELMKRKMQKGKRKVDQPAALLEDQNAESKEKMSIGPHHKDHQHDQQSQGGKTLAHSLSHIIGRDSVHAATLVPTNGQEKTLAPSKPGSKLTHTDLGGGRVKISGKVNKMLVQQPVGVSTNGSETNQIKYKTNMNQDAAVNYFSSAEKMARLPQSQSKCRFHTTGKKNETSRDSSPTKSGRAEKMKELTMTIQEGPSVQTMQIQLLSKEGTPQRADHRIQSKNGHIQNSLMTSLQGSRDLKQLLDNSNEFFASQNDSSSKQQKATSLSQKLSLDQLSAQQAQKALGRKLQYPKYAVPQSLNATPSNGSSRGKILNSMSQQNLLSMPGSAEKGQVIRQVQQRQMPTKQVTVIKQVKQGMVATIVGPGSHTQSRSQVQRPISLVLTQQQSRQALKGTLHLPANDQSRHDDHSQIGVQSEEKKSTTPKNHVSGDHRSVSSLSYVDEGFKDLVKFYEAEDQVQNATEGSQSPKKALSIVDCINQGGVSGNFQNRSRQPATQTMGVRKSIQALPPLSNGKLATSTLALSTVAPVAQHAMPLSRGGSPVQQIQTKFQSSKNNSGAKSKDDEIEKRNLLQSCDINLHRTFQGKVLLDQQAQPSHKTPHTCLNKNFSTGQISLSRLKKRDETVEAVPTNILRVRTLSRGSSKGNRKIINCSPDPHRADQSRQDPSVDYAAQPLQQASRHQSLVSGNEQVFFGGNPSSQANESVVRVKPLGSSISSLQQSTLAVAQVYGTDSTSDRIHQQLELFKTSQSQGEKVAAFQNCLRAVAKLQLNHECQTVLMTLADQSPSLAVQPEESKKQKSAQLIEADQLLRQKENEIMDLRQMVSELGGRPVSHIDSQRKIEKRETEILPVCVEKQATSNASTDKKCPVTQQSSIGFKEFLQRFDSHSAQNSEQTNRRIDDNRIAIDQATPKTVPGLHLQQSGKKLDSTQTTQDFNNRQESANSAGVPQPESRSHTAMNDVVDSGSGQKLKDQLPPQFLALKRPLKFGGGVAGRLSIPSLDLNTIKQPKQDSKAEGGKSHVMRTQLRAELAEHVINKAESDHKTDRKCVLELSWDNESRDLAKTIQGALECVYIRGQSASGNPRTTVLSIAPNSIKTVGRDVKDKSLLGQSSKAESKRKKEGKVAPPRDFQDEFMSKYNEFSQSWRDLIDKGKRF